jgi:hypothetical protein
MEKKHDVPLVKALEALVGLKIKIYQWSGKLCCRNVDINSTGVETRSSRAGSCTNPISRGRLVG